jgi:hypothetical protein
MVDRLITSVPPPTAPGIYAIISSSGAVSAPSGLGVVAIVGKASFGPIGVATYCGSPQQVATVFGAASSVDRSSTTSTLANLAREAAIGGAIGFVAVRVGGTGATTAQVTGGVMDDASTVVGQLRAAYPGVAGNTLTATVRPVAGTTTQKELVVFQGTTIVQDNRFSTGTGVTDEPALLAAATVGAPYVVFTKTSIGSGKIGVAPASNSNLTFTGGADPATPAPGDYTTAFASLSTMAWATLVTDSENTQVFSATSGYTDSETLWGRFRTACVGEPTSIPISQRYADAATLNSCLVRYVGNGFTYPNGDGTFRTVEGYLAAATDAGIMSTLTPGTSMTWRTIPGATGVVVGTPAYDEPTAIISGMGYYKYSNTLGVRTGAGISTLVNPAVTPVWAIGLNPGWKYLEHVATAFGLLGEIGDTWESMVANPMPALRPPNTPAGRDALVAAANRSAKKYVDNNWIQSGTVIVDPTNPPTSNTAFFTFQSLVVALRAERLVLSLPFGTP